MSIPPANMRTGLLLILCLSCAGCVHFSTPAQRDASFARYRDARVGTEDLWEYLIARSGILVGAESLHMTSAGTNSIRFNIKKTFGYATAAPIDQRGYFLTAAHNVEKGQVWLGFRRDDRVQVEHARIVWRGDKEKREPDLALLCVSHPIDRTFQWAEEFTNGSPVVDVGLSWDDHSRNLKPQCMAGKVVKVSEPLHAASLDYTVVSHSSPLRPGDSGGPLLLCDGRLVAINIGYRLDFQWSHLSFGQHSEAHRPDLAWLRRIIETDAALQ